MNNKDVILPILLIMFSIGLHGCDKEKDSGDSATVSVVVPGYLDVNTGLRIASFGSRECGNTYFYYADNGKIDYVTRGNYRKYDFSPDGKQITYTYRDPDNEYSKEDGTYTLNYDVFGRLSSVGISITDRHEDGNRNTIGTERGGASFTYDKLGYLESMSLSLRDSWSTTYSNGESSGGSDLYSLSISMSWQNNLLQKMISIDNEGEDRIYFDTITFIYDNPDYVNKYKQITPFTSLVFYDEWDIFSCLGLLGKGPDLLPSEGISRSESRRDGKSDFATESGILHFDFMNNGAIIRFNDLCDFTYDYGVIR